MSAGTKIVDNFDLLAEATGGVRRLRELVLELAVGGKLVPQDPKDEPARRLLEKIERERAHSGPRGRGDKNSAGTPEGVPFVVPKGWLWTALPLISAIEDGALCDGPFGSALKTEHYVTKPGYRVIRLGNIGWGTFVGTKEAYIDRERYLSLVRHEAKATDVVIASLGDPPGRACLVPRDIGPAIVKADCFRLRVHPSVAPQYVVLALNSPTISAHYLGLQRGDTRGRITLGHLRSGPFPLPPFAEQKRIVAKVDQLMALCDELEARQATKRDTGTRLTKSALEALTTAETPKDLDLAWSRVSENFTTLFDKSLSISVLRRALLDLAARGRLTSAKALATDDGVRRDGPFPIPAHWNWLTGRSLFSFITSGSRGWAQFYADDGPLFLRIGNLDYERVELDLRSVQRVVPPKDAEGTRTRVAPGDVLVSITGDTGMVGLVPDNIGEAYINQHIALCRPKPEKVIPEYVARVLTAPALLGRLQGKQRGIKNSLGLEDVRDLAIPVPPLTEQGTLLAQLRKFMQLCDRTERQFVNAEALAGRLSIAVVAALARGESA